MIYTIARYVLFLCCGLMLLYGLAIIQNPEYITGGLEIFSQAKTTEIQVSTATVKKYFIMLVQVIGGLIFIVGLIGIITVRKSFLQLSKSILAIIFLVAILGHIAPIAFAINTNFFGWIGTMEIVSFCLGMIAFMLLTIEYSNTKSTKKRWNLT